MDALPETPEEKAAAKFLLTAIFTGILLFKNADIASSLLVDKAEQAADEIVKRIPTTK